MNFRYQAIVFGFLAVAIHFHNGESVGTISLAQQGAPAAAPATPAVNTADPNLDFDETTKENRKIVYRLQQRKKNASRPTASSHLSKSAASPSEYEVVLTAIGADGKVLTDDKGDLLKLFGNCESGCKSELTWPVTLEETKGMTEILAAIEKGNSNFDTIEKKKADDLKLAEEKRLKCEGIAKAQDTAKCLGERYADTSLTEEQRAMIKERLVEIVKYGIDSNPKATIDFLTLNPTIRALIPSDDLNIIAEKGGDSLAGESAFANAATIQRATDLCFDAQTTGRYDQCLRARESARRANLNGKSDFEKKFRGAFGTSGFGRLNVADTWANANLKHDRAITSLFSLTNNREMNQRILAGVEVMGDSRDIRPALNMNLRSSIQNVNGRIVDLDGDGEVDDVFSNNNGNLLSRNSRRTNGTGPFGRCGDGNPANNLNCVFQDYMRNMQGNMSSAGSLLVNGGSTFNTGNSIINSGGGRMSNGRPGAGQFRM